MNSEIISHEKFLEAKKVFEEAIKRHGTLHVAIRFMNDTERDAILKSMQTITDYYKQIRNWKNRQKEK